MANTDRFNWSSLHTGLSLGDLITKLNGRMQGLSSILNKNFQSGTWQNPLWLGGSALWVEVATGKLRIKASAPTADNDGTVVGTQV